MNRKINYDSNNFGFFRYFKGFTEISFRKFIFKETKVIFEFILILNSQKFRFLRMNNQETFDKKLVKKKIIKMLRENTQIQQQSVDTFSRHVPSFYTVLCVEIYGKYANSGLFFNKAIDFYRKIIGDTQFVTEIIARLKTEGNLNSFLKIVARSIIFYFHYG